MAGLFGSKQTINNTQTKIGALRIQNSSQGVPIPIVFGRTRITSNLLWYGDFTAIPHTESQTQGGKGGGGVTTTNTTYTYTVGVILGLCEGQSTSTNFLGPIWKNKDITNESKMGLTQFDGSYSQASWSYMVTNHPTEALPYRGTVYAATGALDLGSSDSLPNMSFEVDGSLAGPGECSDINPADAVVDLLTNANYGAGWTAPIDVTDWAQYCIVMNFLASPAYVQQTPAADMVTELAKVGNAAPVWSDGTLKIVPYADANLSSTTTCLGGTQTFTPDLTVRYYLTYSDFIAPAGNPPIKVTRKRPSDAFNAVQVGCLDRSNNYNKHVAEAKDQASIDLYGLRPAPVLSAEMICVPSIGRDVAQTVLQRELYVRNTYEFTVGWRYARLEPMDIVALTDPLLHFANLPVRIRTIEEDEFGKLTITAEDLTTGVSTPGASGTQGSSGYVVNNDVDPGNTNTPVIFQPPVELSISPQIWIGAAGGANWGGAEVWASDDGTSYAKMGIIVNPARYGVLTANFPAGTDPDGINSLLVDLSTSNGTLTSATTTQADAGDTISYIGTATAGEIVGYTTATLTGAHNYTMSGYIRRGLDCSLSMDHVTGDSFMRLDAAVGKFSIDESRVGNTIHIKLLSYNKTGGGLQSLGSVGAHDYVVQPLGITAVNGVIPSTITAQQVLCIPPTAQYTVTGRMTLQGRINCDGRLIIH
jgi:hypothetical protein